MVSKLQKNVQNFTKAFRSTSKTDCKELEYYETASGQDSTHLRNVKNEKKSENFDLKKYNSALTTDTNWIQSKFNFYLF